MRSIFTAFTVQAMVALLLFGSAAPTVDAVFIPTANAATTNSVITATALQENMEYLFPSGSYLSGLDYHSTWEKIDQGTLSSSTWGGIEVTYEAQYDAVPEQADELPRINAYVIPMSSQSAAQSQWEAWQTSSYVTNGTWEILSTGADTFTYTTTSSYTSEPIKARVLEEGSLHLVAYYDNVLIVVNFYRESGSYLKNNVSAYLEYLDDYENTTSIMNEWVIYVEEALKFYLDSDFSVEGPGDEDYHADSADYSWDLSLEHTLPRNGTLSFSLYLDDASEFGTILDMAGAESPTTGDMVVRLDQDAKIEFSLYAPEKSSNCGDDNGWHTLSSTSSLSLYDWESVTLGYGQGGITTWSGMNLWINGAKEANCSLTTMRADQSLYLGDYPDDDLTDSFIGYVKTIGTTFSVDETGTRLDDLASNLIFSDVSELHKYATAIEYMKEEGIISGYSDGSFKPEQDVNRVEILKMLLLGFGYDVPTDTTVPNFSDVVDSSAWYLSYLNFALDLKIVKGYDDGSYQPGNPVNRVEFLKILTASYGISLNDYPITTLYADTDADAWYAAYVQFSKDNGLMDTDSAGNFNPAASVSRGEVAETIYRLLTQ